MGKGGGSAPAQPTTQTVQQSNIPEYARPYFEDIMQRGQAVSQAEYQPYTGQRVAEFNPMQQQAFQGIQNLGVSPLIGAGAGMTGTAGIGGLMAGQNYAQQATSPGAIQAYMSPYMQNVVDFQKSQAIQDYGRQLPGQQAAATRAGAFGGSRQAIVEAEAQRNLQNQLAGIQAQGTQSAFDAARQAQQFGSQLGLQGLGLAGQMGQQFGQLGQTAFGQQAAAAQAQQQAGAIQQAQEQQKKDLAYEEFMRQQLYPQSQLQFLSSLLRGSVVAPQQTMYTYQQQPSMVSQLGGLGLGALGLSKAFGAKDGGEVPGYAEGGEVERFAEGGLASNVAKLTKFLMASQNPEQDIKRMGGTPIEKYLAMQKVQQLRGAMQNQQALDRGVPQGTVMDEAGLAGMDAGVMEEPYAGGGIVAFQYGGSSMGAEMGGMPEQEVRRKPTPEEVDAAIAARRARGENLGLAQILDIQAGNLGLPAALPQPAAPKPAPAAPAAPAAAPKPRPEISPARAAATAAPAVKPEESDVLRGLRDELKGLESPEDAEEAARKRMRAALPDDLKERLEGFKVQAEQAKKDRDQDRWLAVAMGGFAAAAGSSPYALKNFGEGLGLTSKELMNVNKDFRKAEQERRKLETEEKRLARAESLGIEKEAQAARERALARRDAYNKALLTGELKLKEIAEMRFKTETQAKSDDARTAAIAGSAADRLNKDPLMNRYNTLSLLDAQGKLDAAGQAELKKLNEMLKARSEATKAKLLTPEQEMLAQITGGGARPAGGLNLTPAQQKLLEEMQKKYQQ